MSRHLLLFAREPAREARDKGLPGAAATELFEGIARGWVEAARMTGAELAIASPPEDRVAWSRRLRGFPEPRWIPQRGTGFGERLRAAATRASVPGGLLLVVGGDVVPDASDLERAFALLEGGSDAVLAPAPDGGVSLVGIPFEDLDLLGAVAPRRRDVFARLRSRLLSRGRRVGVLALARDVDGRRTARRLLREAADPALRSLTRSALRLSGETRSFSGPSPLSACLCGPPGLRAPPAA